MIIDSGLTFVPHIDSKVNVANAFLGMIRRNFSFLDKDTLVRLYIAFVRPHLALWSPSRAPLIRKLEAVQIRALNLVPEFKGLSYDEQLRCTKLTTLSFRRLRGDMIDTWKHFNTYHRDVISSSFQPSPRNPIRLTQTGGRSGFYHRVQELWNALPISVRQANTVDTFKNRLDRHWFDLPLKYDYLAKPPIRIHQLRREPHKNSR